MEERELGPAEQGLWTKDDCTQTCGPCTSHTSHENLNMDGYRGCHNMIVHETGSSSVGL